MTVKEDVIKKILLFQKNEITEYHIYMKLSKSVHCPNNSAVLEKIANDELRQLGARLTGAEPPSFERLRRVLRLPA